MLNGQCSEMRLSERRAKWSMFNGQCSMVIMPSVSILGEANGQCSMVKNAIKRAQSRTCSSYAEREHFRRSQWSSPLPSQLFSPQFSHSLSLYSRPHPHDS